MLQLITSSTLYIHRKEHNLVHNSTVAVHHQNPKPIRTQPTTNLESADDVVLLVPRVPSEDDRRARIRFSG